MKKIQIDPATQRRPTSRKQNRSAKIKEQLTQQVEVQVIPAKAEMEGYEKQVAMLQGRVVDEIPEGGQEIQPDWTGLTKLDCTLAGLKECEEIQPGVFRYREGAEEERQA